MLLRHVVTILFVEAAIFLWLVFTQAILVSSCQSLIRNLTLYGLQLAGSHVNDPFNPDILHSHHCLSETDRIYLQSGNISAADNTTRHRHYVKQLAEHAATLNGLVRSDHWISRCSLWSLTYHSINRIHRRNGCLGDGASSKESTAYLADCMYVLWCGDLWRACAEMWLQLALTDATNNELVLYIHIYILYINMSNSSVFLYYIGTDGSISNIAGNVYNELHMSVCLILVTVQQHAVFGHGMRRRTTCAFTRCPLQWHLGMLCLLHFSVCVSCACTPTYLSIPWNGVVVYTCCAW